MDNIVLQFPTDLDDANKKGTTYSGGSSSSVASSNLRDSANSSAALMEDEMSMEENEKGEKMHLLFRGTESFLFFLFLLVLLLIIYFDACWKRHEKSSDATDPVCAAEVTVTEYSPATETQDFLPESGSYKIMNIYIHDCSLSLIFDFDNRVPAQRSQLDLSPLLLLLVPEWLSD